MGIDLRTNTYARIVMSMAKPSIQHSMLDAEDLGPADESLLELLQDGRVTAPYAATETGYTLQYVRDRLTRLVEHGHVEKIYEGLYQLVDDPRNTG